MNPFTFFLRKFLGASLLFLALSAGASAQVALNAQEQAILNDLRGAGQHRPFLQVDATLTKVARQHAADMAKRHYFAHVNPDGHGPNWMVRNAGYVLPAWWGTNPTDNYIESIAAGEPTAGGTWNDWMNSPEHKTHLLATDSFYQDQTNVGIGYVADANSDYGYYWVVITAPPQPIPTLTVTSPAQNVQVTNSQLPVSGATGTTIPATSVVFRVENSKGTGAFQTASGVTAWSGTATGLIPGSNIVRVRSLDGSGATQVEVARTVLLVQPTPLTVSVSGTGSVTAGFLGSSNRNLGFPYTIAATAGPGMIFSGWTGSATSGGATLPFVMSEGFHLTANFIPNPFPAVRGTYSGILSGADAGLARFSVSASGIVSAAVTVNGAAYSATGRLAANGSVTLSIPRRGLAPLVITAHLDLSGHNGVTGTIADGDSTATFSSGPSWNAATAPYPHAGHYTVALAPDPHNSDASLPQGTGYAVMTVGTNAVARVNGVLPNGRTFSYGGYVTSSNTLGVYVPLGGTVSALTGSLSLNPTSVSDLQGTLHWTQAANAAAKIHPAAIDAHLPTVGSLYVRPAAGKTVVQVPTGPNNSQLGLSDGDLASPVMQTTTLNTNNQLLVSAPVLPRLNASINLVTGVYRGSFINPVTNTASMIGGVIFQKQDAGYGLFLSATAGGSSSLAPAQ